MKLELFGRYNILETARKAMNFADSNQSNVLKYPYGDGHVAIKKWRRWISKQQIDLYKEATDLSIPIVAAFTTQTPLGVITYEAVPIDLVVESFPAGKVFSVSQFIEKDKVKRPWSGYEQFGLNGLKKLSSIIMNNTGFNGINIIPYNTRAFKTSNGILCRITDLCIDAESLWRGK